jgi:hypothetical protein
MIRERQSLRRSLVGEAMPARLRPRLEPTDDWLQLQLLSQFPEQLTYELIRPVVLFGHSPAERAEQTGAAARTLYRQFARFAKEGMASLFAPQVEKHRRLPAAVRDAILSPPGALWADAGGFSR